MSRLLVEQYHKEVEKLISYGGARKETSIRTAFQRLLEEYCKKKDFILIPELDYKTPYGNVVYPDGTIKDALRLAWGYWESKDEYDNIDEEIIKKFDKGYPKDNILFEDSKIAVLYQAGREIARISMKDTDALDRIISAFIEYQRPEVRTFRDAIENFKKDIPQLSDSLRDLIENQSNNKEYIFARDFFLELCKETINPDIVTEDIREMIIQHILTEDIFNTIFEETQFHRENNIARQLEEVIETFFTKHTKHQYLDRVHHYYAQIKAAAAGISNHHEKQKFLKIIYENFYKAYNPKGADRLGVVYTPNEIVRFMIESADYLCYKHFGKMLSDKNVEILDPATGTGTFITEIIEFMPVEKMKYKYENEIHANEIAILPYYIANLNIEYTYKQKTGKYKEFQNICFVDTLDNMAFEFKGQQIDAFSGMSQENKERIKRQNDKKISIIIGNPPYNSNQKNFNEFNSNREYKKIDKRIKETYIKNSNATKTKVYDMFARFFRWATDRIDENGIVCFITNNAYINKKTYDGFRKIISDEFQNAYIIDLGGDIRELSGRDGIYLNEEHTIFGKSAAVGIAIAFLIKESKNKNAKCKIEYIHPTDIRATRYEKIEYLIANKFSEFPFQHIIPDNKHSWISQGEEGFSKLIPLIKKNELNSLFEMHTNGVGTNKDEWVYDFSKKNLENKISFFTEIYNSCLGNNKIDESIKWSHTLSSNANKSKKASLDFIKIIDLYYRPFIKLKFYSEKLFNDRLTQNHYDLFGKKNNFENKLFSYAYNEQTPLIILAINKITDLNFCARGGTCVSLYHYDDKGNRKFNITDWGLEQFTNHYQNEVITKEDIFNYVYGLLHNPEYRKKYEMNLKREFPRIPFYDEFRQWAEWGKKLMDLHINFETVEPYPLERKDLPWDKERSPKAKLSADKQYGIITLDEQTSLTGIPKETWDYKLGNRSAVEWILDQYKEKTPKDPTIREKFNTYRFADYKEKVIDLIMRVTTVSIETMKIIKEMEIV